MEGRAGYSLGSQSGYILNKKEAAQLVLRQPLCLLLRNRLLDVVKLSEYGLAVFHRIGIRTWF
jgi:hypothetical protein